MLLEVVQALRGNLPRSRAFDDLFWESGPFSAECVGTVYAPVLTLNGEVTGCKARVNKLNDRFFFVKMNGQERQVLEE